MNGFRTIEEDDGRRTQGRDSTDLPNSRVKNQGVEKMMQVRICYAAKWRAATNGIGDCLVDGCVKSSRGWF